MHLTALLLLIFSSTATTYATSPPSAYEILKEFNFPIGLLPKGASRYELNNSTGEFTAYLSDACSFSLHGSYDLRYKPIIKGFISKNKLSKLQGVNVKVAFLWMDEFSVGITSADFPVDDFNECPQCGCGFDCGDKAEKFQLD